MNRQGYTGPRPDVLALIPDKPKRILDVGCGSGQLGVSIKRKWEKVFVAGVDYDPDLIEQAERHLDQVFQVDLNSPSPFGVFDVDNDFDVIIFADVLEHVLSPERLLEFSKKLLAENGCIITSLPNVRHYSTFVSLGLLGVWPRRDRGIHDRTHLHFYTKKDIVALFEVSGLVVNKEKRNVRLVEKWSWTNVPGKVLDFWPFRGFLTFQYLHRLVINKDTLP